MRPTDENPSDFPSPPTRLPEPAPLEEAPSTPGPRTPVEAAAPLTVDESSSTPTGSGATDRPSGAVERYELRDEVGRGGIGLVLRGHDPRLGRDLALKVLLQRHAGKAEVVRRFVEEAQIGGQLQHPGVVPIYDLGSCDDGRPFFTMKLVKGQGLARLLAERDEPTRDLARFLKIFEQVCQTVAYAHSRGVIHRDLKPANVMVGAFGEVQVMDWGLAKVLSTLEEKPAHPPTETVSVLHTLRTGLPSLDSQPGSVLGTPAYMAPEQALGEVERLDRRCDVFGLGAMLCEILTGQPPYVGPDREAVHRQAVRADLADAFARLDGCGADGDLVALTRRCLAAEPSDRPRNAGEVADVVAAYLAGVEQRLRQAEVERAAAQARAEEETRTRRVAEEKVAVERRARRLTLGLAAAVLVLISGAALGGLWWQQQQAERQAEAERQRLAFAADLDQVSTLRQQERWAEARAVLEQTGQRLGADGPEDFRQQLAQATADIDLVDRLEGIRLKRSKWVEGTFDNRTAEQEYATVFRESGLGQEGEAAEAVAARIRESAVAGRLLAALDDWADVTQDLKRLAWLLAVARLVDRNESRNRFRDPNAWWDRAKVQELATELLGDETKLAALRPPLVSSLGDRLRRMGGEAVPLLKVAQLRWPNDFWVNFNLAYAFAEQKKWDKAEGYYRVAVALRPEAKVPHHNLGIVLRKLERPEEAIVELREALAIDPKDALAHNGLGNALSDLMRPEEAIIEYRKALAIDPKDPHAHAHYNLGNVLQRLKRPEEAIVEYRKALAIDPKRADAHHNLGNALKELKRPEEAIVEFHKALAIDPKYALAHNGLGNALSDLKRYDEAIVEFRKALAIDPKHAPIHNNLGTVLNSLKRYDEAIVEYRKALEIDPKLAAAHTNLGSALLDLKRPEEAIVKHRKALEIDPRYPTAHINLGNALRALKRPEEAIVEYRKALEIDPKYVQAHSNLGAILLEQGRFAEAREATRRGLELLPQGDPGRHLLDELLIYCEQGLALEKKAGAMGADQVQPANDAERLARAFLCQQPYKRYYVTSVRLYTEAFANNAKFADDLQHQYRFNAACSAALAAAGLGEEARLLPDKVAFRLRGQALDWLRADLAVYRKLAERNAAAKQQVRQRLTHWQQDEDLSSVREAKALAQLFEPEQQAWRQLWADVTTLLKQVTKAVPSSP
jgi:serine/threonine-protein kinase